MDELEFCVKTLSYPLGMVLEGLERRAGERIHLEGRVITLPEIPFPAKCYLVALAVFEGLDAVDRKRLSDDYLRLEEFRKKILSSKLAEAVERYMKNPWTYVERGGKVSIDWLEFERREERVRPYLEKLRSIMENVESRGKFLEKTRFLEELSVDEGLLLGYLSEDDKLRELINASLGKHNREFKALVIRYFKALRG